MPQAVTHVLIAIILVDLVRHLVKNKRRFPVHYVFIAGIAGLLPDTDVFLYLVQGWFGITSRIYRPFTHSLIFLLLFIILGILTIKTDEKSLGKHHIKLSNVFFVIAAGVFIHFLLDATVEGYIMPFYPISTAHLGLNLVGLTPYPSTLVNAIDALILLLWLWHEERTRKISDFF